MADWRECRLGDLGTVIGGGTPSREKAEFWDGDIPWITPGELTGSHNKYISETQDCISELGLDASGAQLLPGGSLLVTSRATIGSSALTAKPVATNQGFKNLIPNANVDPSFLLYLSQSLGREMKRRASGTTFLEISGREFERIVVRIPTSAEEQRRIAEILDTIDEAIQATERLIAKHEKFRDGLAFDLLWDRELDKNLVPIGDIGEVIGGGTPSRERSDYWDGSIPWVTPGELTGTTDKYVFGTKESISERGLSESGATMLPEGSLLMTSRASIGSCALAGVPMATNQGFQNIVPYGDVDSSYLLHIGRGLRREMVRRASGTTFLEITCREFSRISIHLPSLPEQRRIASILDTADETIHRDEAQLAKLRKLRSGLAADLLSGRVRTKAT